MAKKAHESIRGCGYRQVGKLYLMGDGLAWVCPSLPLEIKPCDCCGYEPPEYRDFQWIKKAYIRRIREPTGKACQPFCPICYPGTNKLDEYGLMWVGSRYYTPFSFIKEAKEMGVCKAIKQIPSGLKIGETWILLAHRESVDLGLVQECPECGGQELKHYATEKTGRHRAKCLNKECGAISEGRLYRPGFFYAFRPTGVEMPIYQSDATPERVLELEEKGITPVIIPDDCDAHGPKTRKVTDRVNIA